MAPRVRKGAQVEDIPGRLVSWNGLEVGDPVHVKAYGERGATWRFQNAQLREDGRPAEVTVYGGAKGFASMRTFLEDRIVKLSQKATATRRREPRSRPAPDPKNETLYDAEIRKKFGGHHPKDKA